ncbi:hypothetical protein OG21DRAFT_1476611 [Imleria badia]|nr:hypothetical protein OG21DRAFT_1476611 [Imleria badia]
MWSWPTPWIILWSVPLFGRDARVASLASDANNIVSIDLSIANCCVAPDGFPRVAVLAGKQGEEPTLPGPVISGYKSDRFLINVTNELTDTSMFTGTTIHWHGISQHHSNQMDGTAYVTQCPISPQKSFLYNFTGDDQVGTFWYHSHYAVQYCDGLRGPFIIRDREDPFNELYDFDDDSAIITLMDWYHYPSPDTPRQVWPDSVLSNGTGCYDGLECPPHVTYMVQATKRYRFRLLNMSCKQFYNIFAAQRYSFILNADKPVDNYWIRTIPDPSEPMNATTTAILRYAGAPNVDPQAVNVTNNYLNETLLRSLSEPPAYILEPNPDIRLNVVMAKNEDDYNFMINGVQYTSPSVPVLLQIMNGALSQDIDPVQSIYLLPRDKLVEVTFHVDDTSGRPHPFHLHGHHFAVIKSADSEFRNYDRPVMRDTVSTGTDDKSDNVTIRFVTDNPRPWILRW